MRTSEASSAGTGTTRSVSTSGPPNRSRTAARIVEGTRGARRRVAVRRAGAAVTSERIRRRFMLDGDPVHRGELLDRPPAVVSAEAAVLFTAEGTVRQVVDRRVVHVRHPGLHTLRETVATLDIAGEDSGGQAVARLIRHTQRIVLATDLDYSDHGAEQLLGSDGHVVGCVDEDMRRKHESLRRAAEDLPRAPCACLLDALEQALQLLTVDERTDGRIGLRRVSALQPGDAGLEAIDELVVDRGVHDEPVDRHADLPLMEKLAEDGTADGEIQIGVSEHHARGVAAELEHHALEDWTLGGEIHDSAPDLRRSGE